jgi:hypothetical protein
VAVFVVWLQLLRVWRVDWGVCGLALLQSNGEMMMMRRRSRVLGCHD